MAGKIEDKQCKEMEEARTIMGNNFFGVDHAAEFFGFDPTSEKYEGLDFSKIPYSKKMLEEHKRSHFLVFVTPININTMRSMYPSVFRTCDYFHKSKFTQKEGELGWFLVEKKPKDDALGQVFEKQLVSLSSGEEIIKSQPLIYFLIANFLLNNECLLFNSTARCLDFAFLDFRVCVGKFDLNQGGINISTFWDTSLPNLSIITFLKGDI